MIDSLYSMKSHFRCSLLVLLLLCFAHCPASQAQSIRELARQKEISQNPLAAYDNVDEFVYGRAIAQRTINGNRCYGVIDRQGRILIGFNYTNLELIEQGADFNGYRFLSGGKYGFVRTNGQTLSAEYDHISSFADDFLKVKKDGNYGLLSAYEEGFGSTFLPITCSSITVDGGYIRYVRNGLQGLYDNRFDIPRELLQPLYTSIEDMGDYRFKVKRNVTVNNAVKEKVGIVVCLDDDDDNSKTTVKDIIPVAFDRITSFNRDGLAWVENEGKYGLYNDKGEQLLPNDISEVFYYDGLYKKKISCSSAPELKTLNYYVRQEKMGTFDDKGQIVIPAQYGYISNFTINNQAYAFVMASRKWGIVDKMGKVVCPVAYDAFRVDDVEVSVDRNLPYTFQYITCENYFRFGLLNEKCVPVTNAIYSRISPPHNNLFLTELNNTYGYLTPSGEVAIPFNYAYAQDFSEGLAAVSLPDAPQKIGFINTDGEMVIKPRRYDGVEKFSGGRCKVWRKSKSWYIDREGKKVKEEDFSFSYSFSSKESSNKPSPSLYSSSKKATEEDFASPSSSKEASNKYYPSLYSSSKKATEEDFASLSSSKEASKKPYPSLYSSSKKATDEDFASLSSSKKSSDDDNFISALRLKMVADWGIQPSAYDTIGAHDFVATMGISAYEKIYLGLGVGYYCMSNAHMSDRKSPDHLYFESYSLVLNPRLTIPFYKPDDHYLGNIFLDAKIPILDIKGNFNYASCSIGLSFGGISLSIGRTFRIRNAYQYMEPFFPYGGFNPDDAFGWHVRLGFNL